jgi:hypothetical protein
MILTWNDAKSFQRHLEDMRVFRQSHLIDLGEGLKMLKDMPIPFDIKPQCETGTITSFTDTRGKVIIVPLWKITLSIGSQN